MVRVERKAVGVKSGVRKEVRERGAGKGRPESEVEEREELELCGEER